MTDCRVIRTYRVTIPDSDEDRRKIWDSLVATGRVDADEDMTVEGLASLLTFEFDGGDWTDIVEWEDEEVIPL